MKIDEAIQIMKDIYPSQKEIITGEYPDVAESIDLAIAALEKQIGKKPIYGSSNYRTEDNYLGRKITCGECSEQICYEHSVIEHFKFCNKCGQKIDWSEEE